MASPDGYYWNQKKLLYRFNSGQFFRLERPVGLYFGNYGRVFNGQYHYATVGEKHQQWLNKKDKKPWYIIKGTTVVFIICYVLIIYRYMD
jgi:polyferredoxin